MKAFTMTQKQRFPSKGANHTINTLSLGLCTAPGALRYPQPKMASAIIRSGNCPLLPLSPHIGHSKWNFHPHFSSFQPSLYSFGHPSIIDWIRLQSPSHIVPITLSYNNEFLILFFHWVQPHDLGQYITQHNTAEARKIACVSLHPSLMDFPLAWIGLLRGKMGKAEMNHPS